ncbi:MAG: class E sortase [Bacillota bacterium]
MNLKPLKKSSLILIFLGVTLVLYPLFSSFYAHYQQARLKASLAAQEKSSPSKYNKADKNDQNPALSDTPSDNIPTGEGFMGAVIEIPAINLSAAVVKGTARSGLNKGPGWYEQSALPGQGNTAIAGHRTMYGAWFRHVDRLKAGDPIILRYEGKVYRYEVERVFPVANNDWSVIKPCGYPVLTLTTCHPVGSARQRLVVRAALEETTSAD